MIKWIVILMTLLATLCWAPPEPQNAGSSLRANTTYSFSEQPTKIELNWNAPHIEIHRYEVWGTQDLGQPFSFMANVGTNTSYQLVVTNQAYFYAVKAFNAPAEPVTVNLAWDRSIGLYVIGYRIYWRTNDQPFTNFVSVGDVTNATISGLDWGTDFFFAASSYNQWDKEGDLSPEIHYFSPVPTNFVSIKNVRVKPIK